MKGISAIVLTKNEQSKIGSCLESLKWCDEIIVLDDNSTDETVRIAEKFGVKIYRRTLDNFSNQRNYALSKADGEWVLFVDADEVISEVLAFEISNAVRNWTNGPDNQYIGFCIPRVDRIWGKELKYGESGIRLLRLAKKGFGEWGGYVHEHWNIGGKVGLLRTPIRHYPHQTIAEFLKEINFYTTLRSEELYLRKIKSNLLSIILYPTAKFAFNYFLKRGFLDGIPGLVHALLMSFHSFLVRGKLWMLWEKRG